MARIPDKPENEPEDRSFKMFIDVDADYDFGTGTFTPKHKVEIGKLSGTVLSLGSIDIAPEDGGEIYYLPQRMIGPSIELTLRPHIDNEDDEEDNQKGEE